MNLPSLQRLALRDKIKEPVWVRKSRMEDKKMTRHGQKMHSCDEIFGKLHVIHARWYRRQASPCRFLLFLFFLFFFFFFFLVAHKFCLGYMSRLRRLLSSPHVHFEVSFRAGSVRQSLWIKRPWPALTFTIVVNYSKLLFFYPTLL